MEESGMELKGGSGLYSNCGGAKVPPNDLIYCNKATV